MKKTMPENTKLTQVWRDEDGEYWAVPCEIVYVSGVALYKPNIPRAAYIPPQDAPQEQEEF